MTAALEQVRIYLLGAVVCHDAYPEFQDEEMAAFDLADWLNEARYAGWVWKDDLSARRRQAIPKVRS